MSRMYDQDNQDLSLLAKDQYMRYVRWTPDLSEEEEAHLLECVQRGKAERTNVLPDAHILQLAQRARDRLVDGFQPMVLTNARRLLHRFKSMEVLDLVQEGNIGLLQAIEHYDARLGCPLRALASRCIRQALWRARCDRDGLVRLPEEMYTLLSRMHQVEYRLLRTLGREPTLAEIAAALRVREEKLSRMIELSHQSVESLQGLLRDVENVEDRHSFVSLFEVAVVAETNRQSELRHALHHALETALPHKQREVICLRYGLDEEGQARTQDGVAEMLQVCQARVWTAEKRAKERLRAALAPLYELSENEEVA